MNIIKEPTVLQLHTTPKKLREIADKMETKFKTLTAGDSTRVFSIHGDDFVINIHGDQNAFHKYQDFMRTKKIESDWS